MTNDLVRWLLQSRDITERCLVELASWNRSEAVAVRRELAAGGRLRLVVDESAEGVQRLRVRLISAVGANRWVFCWDAGAAAPRDRR